MAHVVYVKGKRERGETRTAGDTHTQREREREREREKEENNVRCRMHVCGVFGERGE